MLTGNSGYETWKKKTALFLTSQTISLFGSSLVQYAITWYITLTTQSGVMMTISILCGFLPMFVMAPFAGVWADRYSRKKLIIYADSMIAAATLVMAVLFFNGYNALWMIFMVSALRAFGSGIQTPAVGAVLPQLVPQEQLTRINGINGSIMAAMTLVSPVISGALLAMSKIEYIFFIDVGTAAVAVFILLIFIEIPLHEKARRTEKISYMNDLKQGVGFINANPFLKRFFIVFGLFCFLISPAAFLTPLQVTRSFGSDVWRLTAIEIAFSAGMIVGGAIIAAWGGFKNKVHTMTLACFIFGVSTLALGVIPVFWIYLCCMGIAGIAVPLLNTPSTVLLQQKVEENFLGRVFGVFSMISTSMMPLGMLVFGPIADSVRIEWILIATGILILVQGLLMSRNKVLNQGGVVEK